jgi:hypothetical protein
MTNISTMFYYHLMLTHHALTSIFICASCLRLPKEYMQCYSQQPSHGNSQADPPLTTGLRKYGIYTQWNFMQPWRRMKCYHSLVNGWNWRTSFWVRLAWPQRPKIVCSPSYVDYSQGTWSHTKGRLCTGGIGKGKKTKNVNVVDVPTVQEWI